MDNFAQKCNEIFDSTIARYHRADNVDAEFEAQSGDATERLLEQKCWIDTVQWHLEDLIRDPSIDPVEALSLKRRIDRSNQERTDLVEQIDNLLLDIFPEEKALPDAALNTESPAWAIDRLSILALKIWHWTIEAERGDAEEAHRAKAAAKLAVMLEQRVDLSQAIDDLLADYASGRKKMKVYRQMKMYNDPATNPVLYKEKK